MLKINVVVIISLLVCSFPLCAISDEIKPIVDNKTSNTLSQSTQPPSAQKNLKICVVEIDRLDRESEPAKATVINMKQKQKEIQTELGKRIAILKKQEAQLKEKLPSLDETQRKTKIAAFDKKVAEFRKFQEEKNKAMGEFQDRLRKELLAVYNQAIAEYGAANRLPIIVGKNTVDKSLIYFEQGVVEQDITDDIVKQLAVNKKF